MLLKMGKTIFEWMSSVNSSELLTSEKRKYIADTSKNKSSEGLLSPPVRN
jgi:hypothetical protein